jgi:predicted nucleic acid-binding Zn ribbon protein
MTAKPLSKCPKCKGKLKKLIGAGSGIIFKGSGFYATDYRKTSGTSNPSVPTQNTCPKTKDGCSSCPHNK